MLARSRDPSVGPCLRVVAARVLGYARLETAVERGSSSLLCCQVEAVATLEATQHAVGVVTRQLCLNHTRMQTVRCHPCTFRQGGGGSRGLVR